MKLPALVRRSLAAAAFAAGLAAGAEAQLACEACHGELELLRQHVPTLEAANALFVPDGQVARSAHGEMTCGRCHDGFRRFPHPEGTGTRTCASCHEAPADAWRQGMHGLSDGATCADCHGTHDVVPVAEVAAPAGAGAIRAACASCHYEAAIPDTDPHVDSVSCTGCHEPHGTLPATDLRAAVHERNQGETCGACHEAQHEAWRTDAHGAAVVEGTDARVAAPARGEPAEAPVCTACHGAHGMTPPSEPGFALAAIERCAGCHAPYRESFADSYHGQAAHLGSEKVAACHDCHGAHGILPASDPASRVSEANRLSTCRTCHESATEGFAKFEPHADHTDRDRYPLVYWSYRLMTTLLVGVFTVFGAHTALWLARLAVERARGARAGARASGG